MMENEAFLKDDFLRELINRSPLDSPSDSFIDNVMAGIEVSPEVAEVKKPFFWYVKASFPYAALTLVMIIVLGSSDLPVFNWLPGTDYLTNNLVPYLGTLFATYKTVFSSKFVSWGLLIGFSTGLLFLADRLFSRRISW